MVYAPRSGKLDVKKERFWNELFHLVSCIHQNETVVFAGDMIGHIGSSNVGSDGTHGGSGYGSRNADGFRILQISRYQKGKTSLDLTEARDNGVWGGISWTICKQSLQTHQHPTTQFLQAGCSS